MVDYLRNDVAFGHRFGVAAAYCNFKERDMQSPENLIAGLCVQLMDDSNPISETLANLYKSHQSKHTRPTLGDILKVLGEAVEHFRTSYLIIDALDECPSEVRDVLVPELKALQPKIKLLVTTRPLESITRGFSGNSTVEVLASRGDLEKYIMSYFARSNRLSSLVSGQDTLVNKICGKIIEMAKGM